MAAYLEINDNGTLRRVNCGGLVTMGRDASANLQVVDPLVSRLHALVRYVGHDSFYLLDAGSRNGSFINQRRVSTPTQLKSDDVITLGESNVTFHLEPSDELLHSGESLILGETLSHNRLEIQPITILVADIRGYSALSEVMPISALSKMMSRWFSDTQEAIEKHQGQVDKFIGDSVMALWYHHQNVQPRTIIAALAAAHALQTLTAGLRESFPDLPHPLELAIGLNTGMAAVGVGHDNTAMGDAVNLAFRLEAACRPLDAQLLLSQSTYQYLPHSFWSERETRIQVRGRSQPVQVCPLRFCEIPPLVDQSSASIVT